ncbi:MAG: hypothetical protein DRQ52_06995, partial [Gammaproteobacteria bacterium]
MNPDSNQLIFDQPDDHQYLVNKRTFTDEELFEAEYSQIYDKLWLYVGHETEIPKPGDFVTRTIARRPLLLVRGSDGHVQVYLNTCTHNGSLVCREPAGNRDFFPCAYHGWVFDRDGELKEVPGESAFGPQFSKSANGLPTPPSQASYQGFVFISFAERGDLPDYLAGAKEYLDILSASSTDGMKVMPGTHIYGTSANWKMLPVNVIDGNHFLPTHVTYLQYLQERGSEMKH